MYESKDLSVKISILPKLIYRVYTIQINAPEDFKNRYPWKVSKFIWKGRGSKIDKIIVAKNKVGGLTLLDSKTYTKLSNQVYIDKRMDTWINGTE